MLLALFLLVFKLAISAEPATKVLLPLVALMPVMITGATVVTLVIVTVAVVTIATITVTNCNNSDLYCHCCAKVLSLVQQ